MFIEYINNSLFKNENKHEKKKKKRKKLIYNQFYRRRDVI